MISWGQTITNSGEVVFSREKEHTDEGYTSFSEDKFKINVHKVHHIHAFETFLDRPDINVHDVHPQEKYELS